MYRTRDLEIFVDLSTYCNAGCPQCHRTSTNNKLQKEEWLPLIQWSLGEFKKAFPENLIKEHTSMFSICGTWGDPVMNKDIKEIIRYIVETNNKVPINLDTNGSLRDEDWWWELGMIAGKSLRAVFAVDGCTQEMHEKYRRFTNLQKVLNNMKSLSETNAIIEGHTILFKHNQDYVEDIKKLCLDNGARGYRVTQSDRFENRNSTEGKYFHFENEKGEKENLEITDYDPPNAFIAHTNKIKLEKKISCRWQNTNRLVVNIDGQVYPCCYIVNSHYKSKFASMLTDIQNHPVMKEYENDKDHNNVFKKPLLDIIKESNWFNNTLPNSWSSNNPIQQCKKHCSSLTKIKHQLKAYL